MTSTETQEILVEQTDSIRTICINRPRRKNALTYETMLRLAEHVEMESKHPDVRAPGADRRR